MDNNAPLISFRDPGPRMAHEVRDLSYGHSVRPKPARRRRTVDEAKA
jgi:hypothetical protein